MIEQQAEKKVEQYCELCGIDVRQDTELKRFGKFFCSNEHIEEFVKAKQRELGLEEQQGNYKGRRKLSSFDGGCC